MGGQVPGSSRASSHGNLQLDHAASSTLQCLIVFAMANTAIVPAWLSYVLSGGLCGEYPNRRPECSKHGLFLPGNQSVLETRAKLPEGPK